MKIQNIYYTLVDQLANETKPHIDKEFGDLDNCETCLNKDSKGVVDKLEGYGIRIANRNGRFGSSNGPNIQTIRKPDPNYQNSYNTNYSQTETSLRRTIKSLRGNVKPVRQRGQRVGAGESN